MRSKIVLTSLMALAVLMTTGPSMGDEATEAKSESINVFNEGTLQVPSQFKRVQPKSRILEHEFQATAGEGKEVETARLTMMAAGGDVAANIKRWQEQLVGGDEEEQKAKQMKLGKWEVHVVDVTGTYAERVGGGPFAGGKVVSRPNYAMAGAILVHPDGRKYFVKLIGPASVVKANRKAFERLVKSIGQ